MELRKKMALAAAGLGLVLTTAACGGMVEESGAAFVQATREAPAVASQPTAQSVGQSAAAAQAAAPVGATKLQLIAGQSTASYTVGEQLAGRDLPNDAVGTTSGVAGSIVLAPDGTVVSGSKVTIDLSTLASDESRRDNFVKSNVLQTGTYPTAEFVPTKLEGLPAALPTSGDAAFKMTGDLTVRGVTQTVTWDVTAQAQPNAVSGTAATTVTFEQFGMTPPKVGPVLSVDEQLMLQIDFQAERAAA